MPSYKKPSLEAGLAALKQENYYAAITQLAPIASSTNQSNTCLQAKVGLVMAYARTGEVAKAIALCNDLINSNNPQVQEWAKLALEHLMKRIKRHKTNKKPENGFVAVDNSLVSSTLLQQQEGLPEHNTSHTDIPKTTITETVNIYWRQARRAKVWQPLRKYNSIPSRLLALGTFMSIFWVLWGLLTLTMAIINQILDKLPYLKPLPLLYSNPSLLILVLLLVLWALSPWLLDWLLAEFYGQQHLSKDILYSHSREAVRVTQRTCQLRDWPVPKLQILPIAAPMMLTYGNLPRTARIVVSQGLLAALNDDEIAAIYALALGQIGRWDFWVMSLALLVTLPFYQLYQQASTWGNKTKNPFGRWTATALSCLSYGIWCLLTGTTLLNSRSRLYYSDRISAEITGNPNGLIRALLKIAIGIANDIKQQEHTSWQLESLNIAAPVSYQQSLCLGSIAGNLPWESFLMWENSNPYRRWFTINNSHPLIGDRIERLCQIARHWHLETEVHLTIPEAFQVKPQSFLLQIAPWLGIPLGCVLAGLFWLMWHTAYTFKLVNLKWIYDDWSFVTGFLMIGFSIGTIMRLNAFFPQIRSFSLQTDDQLSKLLTNPFVLPIDSVSVRLVGKLLGRRGTSNCLAQDLILQSSTGLVKLHHIPWWGISPSSQELIGQQIIITGWLRRGATPWIDIQTLETQSGKIINSPHPIWSTVLAVIAQAWGAYIMLTAQSVGG
ncbi:M48 family metalloprotease [Sphaerospermopsis aphanizomenoides BCCUSP55]|uniref:M48 family metalloprotease n=1 Tax=Sphaerospermopsis aphanizomenoides TaxID=459663 RepID=UPI000A9919C7|nr:M48 family metalloprotease [Sphaerospermopsis aphanizomenoides]MBK1990108.1 M48 family metalloprotease [Sphaerospermopsis aphanizomenoides BCCUSP55]